MRTKFQFPGEWKFQFNQREYSSLRLLHNRNKLLFRLNSIRLYESSNQDRYILPIIIEIN